MVTPTPPTAATQRFTLARPSPAAYASSNTTHNTTRPRCPRGPVPPDRRRFVPVLAYRARGGCRGTRGDPDLRGLVDSRLERRAPGGLRGGADALAVPQGRAQRRCRALHAALVHHGGVRPHPARRARGQRRARGLGDRDLGGEAPVRLDRAELV